MVKIKIFFVSSVMLFSSSLAEAGSHMRGITLHGFIENAYAAKLKSATTKHDTFNMFEQRIQLKTHFYPAFTPFLKAWMSIVNIRIEGIIDEYFDTGAALNIRQCNVIITPKEWLDIKVGRQILTWGTGDYLFINDVFPKDYVSFYIGRDDEYLKTPSDALKLSFYARMFNLDVVILPFFQESVLFTGERLSFFDQFRQEVSGQESVQHRIPPADRLSNTEYAGRFYVNQGSYEIAAYVFRGFYKTPRGVYNAVNNELFYPRLDVYGISGRGPVLAGIGNVEYGFYNARHDPDGDNRLVENSSSKCLIGYEQEFPDEWTVGVQYLFEYMHSYDAYTDALLPGDRRIDRACHLATARIAKWFFKQTLRVSLFSFISWSDKDGYVRPSVSYDVTDQWKMSLGGNMFWGEHDYTQFGQMENNSNIFTRIRYAF